MCVLVHHCHKASGTLSANRRNASWLWHWAGKIVDFVDYYPRTKQFFRSLCDGNCRRRDAFSLRGTIKAKTDLVHKKIVLAHEIYKTETPSQTQRFSRNQVLSNGTRYGNFSFLCRWRWEGLSSFLLCFHKAWTSIVLPRYPVLFARQYMLYQTTVFTQLADSVIVPSLLGHWSPSSELEIPINWRTVLQFTENIITVTRVYKNAHTRLSFA